jgi:hypothetical protein
MNTKWNGQKWIALLVVVTFIGLVSIAVTYRVGFASSSKDDFFRRRDAVYQNLQERAVTPFNGATIVLPPTEESRKQIATGFPGKHTSTTLSADETGLAAADSNFSWN